MKTNAAVTLAFLLAVTPAVFAGEAPHEIGGFVLGKPLTAFESLLKLNTRVPLRANPFIQEIETVDIGGFQSGLIWVGNCTDPGRVVRIRFKYTDSSKSFYEMLLKHYKNRFGEPTEWRGDPFHILIAWKWSFVDADGNRISLILSHNTQDEEEARGNIVKLTIWNLIDAERKCMEEKQGRKVQANPSEKAGAPDWDRLVPR
jgi:hypothetical protein